MSLRPTAPAYGRRATPTKVFLPALSNLQTCRNERDTPLYAVQLGDIIYTRETVLFKTVKGMLQRGEAKVEQLKKEHGNDIEAITDELKDVRIEDNVQDILLLLTYQIFDSRYTGQGVSARPKICKREGTGSLAQCKRMPEERVYFLKMMRASDRYINLMDV